MKAQLDKVNKKNIDMLTKVLNRNSSRLQGKNDNPTEAASKPSPQTKEKKDEYENVVLRSLTFVQKLPKGGIVDPYTKDPLSREVIELAVYKNASFKGSYDYIRLKVFSNKGSGVAYVRNGEINQIKRKSWKK